MNWTGCGTKQSSISPHRLKETMKILRTDDLQAEHHTSDMQIQSNSLGLLHVKTYSYKFKYLFYVLNFCILVYKVFLHIFCYWFKQEGLEPPSHLPRHYEHLLLTIARLYRCTNIREHLNFDLVLDYWNSADVLPAAATGSTSYHFRSSFRQVCCHCALLLALQRAMKSCRKI